MKDDILRRFAYIETCLYWGDGITASQLGKEFGIARQNAQPTINAYRKAHPNNMIYNPSKKRHIATEAFEPRNINKAPERYLDYLAGIYAVEHYWQVEQWTQIPFESDYQCLTPPQDVDIVKMLLTSIQEEQALSVVYQAKYKVRHMTIAAGRLVYANYRYHVRAYDYEAGWFIDLVLTRFREIEKAEEKWVSPDNDQYWHKQLKLRFQINPDLPQAVQESLQMDYRLGKSTIRTITVRQAMLGYICREMERIDWKYGIRIWLDMDNHCYQK